MKSTSSDALSQTALALPNEAPARIERRSSCLVNGR
jgi:hypothetical protein